MARHRTTKRRHSRKQRDAELEQLTVPQTAVPAEVPPVHPDSEPAREAEAQAERIRRMIETAYT